MSKTLEYKVLKTQVGELETTLNIYAQDGFRVVHFFPPDEEKNVEFVISRKQKTRKKHHEIFPEDQGS